MSKELIGYLESQLKALKLKGMLTHYQEITQKAAQNNLSYPEYLSLLLEEELRRKNEGTVKPKSPKPAFPLSKPWRNLTLASSLPSGKRKLSL